MARAQGWKTQMRMAFESTFAQPPSDGYVRMPYRTADIGATQEFSDDPVMGLGREAQEPSRDALEQSGTVSVPLDTRAIGYWLKLLLGAPSTSGSGPYTHTFDTSAEDLPSASIEMAYSAGRILQHLGNMANTLSLTLERSGFVRADIGLTGSTENKLTSSAATSTTEHAFNRFNQTHGLLKRDGTTFADITQASLEYGNGLDPAPTVGDGGVIGAIDEGLITVTGSIRARFSGWDLYDLAANNESFELKMGWRISADQSITFTLPDVRLSRTTFPVEGPGGVESAFSWRSVQPDGGRQMTVELINDLQEY